MVAGLLGRCLAAGAAVVEAKHRANTILRLLASQQAAGCIGWVGGGDACQVVWAKGRAGCAKVSPARQASARWALGCTSSERRCLSSSVGRAGSIVLAVGRNCGTGSTQAARLCCVRVPHERGTLQQGLISRAGPAGSQVAGCLAYGQVRPGAQFQRLLFCCAVSPCCKRVSQQLLGPLEGMTTHVPVRAAVGQLPPAAGGVRQCACASAPLRAA